MDRDAVVLSRGAAAAVLVCCCIAALALHVSAAARVVAKTLVDPLLHATSVGGVLVLLAFAALSAVSLTVSNRPASWRRERLVGAVLVCAVTAGAAANTLGHAYAMRVFDLPLLLPAYVWTDDRNTYSYLLHSHSGKAATTALLSTLARPFGLDVGQAWGEELAPWVAILCGVSLVAALAACAWLLPRIARRTGGGAWAAALFALAAVNAIKAIADGGLLTYRAVPSIAVLFVLASSADLRRPAPQFVVLALLATGAYAACSLALEPNGAGEASRSLLLLIAIYCCPLAWAWRKVAPLRGGAMLAVSLAIALAFYARELWAGPGVLLRPLPSGYVAVVVDPQTLHTSTEPAAGLSPLAVYARHGEDVLKPRFVFLQPGSGPVRSPPRLALLVVALSEGPGVDTPGELPWQLDAIAYAGPRDRRLLLLTTAGGPLARAFEPGGVLAQNNYYCLLHGLAAQLRAGGLQRFVMAPIRDARDLARLQPTPPGSREPGSGRDGSARAPRSQR